ncbi:aminodeoxychorismate synthase [Verticillium dahliae VdLs.17]|uniref:aminodeoxychorismate synthase n=1 Tax=Verticillium dahliae (strain VdLs.17 / ATCC MYA-4575 / FGSC 10137) TaxID=498257 RepID=G2XE11_VERDV|nr:aminodeoxychorismate synthase [Verticillium dahliae VdLs.17]EGY18059.1 aminodeoxychorismate synthase [Verticillium dahliae VdLs.17]
MRPQILFLDAYDSFTNNIVSLLTTLLDADVHVLPIDTPLLDPQSPDFAHAFGRELAHYHAVVCGPGPGSPDHEADVGLIRAIWALGHDDLLPVLGVCLGFQSLVLSAGARVRRLRRGLHGMVRPIDHHKPAAVARKLKGDMFHAVPPFSATLYHSLCADVGQDAVPAAAWPARRWDAPSVAPDLLPLAWASEDRGDREASERILMAARHRAKPFWGVQYHPESVCTHAAGHAVLRNWFREAMRWNAEAQRDVVTASDGRPLLARHATRPSLLSQVRRLADEHAASVPWTETTSPLATVGLDCAYTRKTLALPPHLGVPDLVEMLRRGTAASSEHIILDSANADKLASGAADVRGRYSIIALDGTVRKSAAVATLAAAEAILHVPKEEAENLMIVDLVRHDLHGVCGPGRVAVPHLMRVEEYASVFQMITVVDARLPERRRGPIQPQADAPHTGLDVLAASLPPGSMTGAPKKRSCELLAELEGRERGLYSGVIGYMDVTGRGDWSVTIRTMWRWDDEEEGEEGEGGDVWHIGAGGAVTILSTPEGETEEMFTKLAGPLGVFSQ